MKPLRFVALFAAMSAAALVAAPAARAFTIDDQSNTAPGGGARYLDPDSQFSSGSSSSNSSSYRSGNTTLQFGSPSQSSTFNQRYDSNRMFDTLGGPGRDGYR